jgi:hypothetical protein
VGCPEEKVRPSNERFGWIRTYRLLGVGSRQTLQGLFTLVIDINAPASRKSSNSLNWPIFWRDSLRRDD